MTLQACRFAYLPSGVVIGAHTRVHLPEQGHLVFRGHRVTAVLVQDLVHLGSHVVRQRGDADRLSCCVDQLVRRLDLPRLHVLPCGEREKGGGGETGDGVVRLEHVRERRVIDDEDILHAPPEVREILDVVAVVLHARLTEQTRLDHSAAVENVQQRVGILAERRGEDDDLELLSDDSQEVIDARSFSHVDPVDDVLELDRDDEVGVRDRLEGGVDERLIEIQHEALLADVLWRERPEEILRGWRGDDVVAVAEWLRAVVDAVIEAALSLPLRAVRIRAGRWATIATVEADRAVRRYLRLSTTADDDT
jgi:hypothetical protein